MNARRNLILSTLGALLLAPMLGAHAQTAAAERPHKVVFQVSDADPAKWNLALNNARNVQQDLGSDKVTIEIVAYGPGIGMLKLDSVAGARVAEAMASGMSVVACENTMRNQKITREDMLPKIGYVGAGVVQLMARQKEGYAYIRP
jgi:intracellular sulfur oxidation DsrE/DsrF family protein